MTASERQPHARGLDATVLRPMAVRPRSSDLGAGAFQQSRGGRSRRGPLEERGGAGNTLCIGPEGIVIGVPGRGWIPAICRPVFLSRARRIGTCRVVRKPFGLGRGRVLRLARRPTPRRRHRRACVPFSAGSDPLPAYDWTNRPAELSSERNRCLVTHPPPRPVTGSDHLGGRLRHIRRGRGQAKGEGLPEVNPFPNPTAMKEIYIIK